MKAIFTASIRKAVVRVLHRIFVDATLGAICGGLYGFVFGGFGAHAQYEPRHLLSVAGIFALCSAVAGLLVGAYSAILDASGKSTDAPSSAL